MMEVIQTVHSQLKKESRVKVKEEKVKHQSTTLKMSYNLQAVWRSLLKNVEKYWE